jgi:hypothetical protein
MKCKICGTDNQACFSSKILGKYDVNYYHCSVCDFVQTEDPYWLDEAYSCPINLSDTGYMVRNQFYAKRLTILLYLLFGKNGQFLDYAGGYGVFVRMMRDIGFDFYWDDKYTQNIFATGFEWKPISKVDAVTLFEVFEHFVDPIDEIKKLLTISNTIIFSTDLHPNPVPQPNDWWYYGLDHGQHIAFYSTKTFEYIVEKLQLNYLNVGSFHVLSRSKLSPWKLTATKFSKFGLHKIIAKMMVSKTWTDYERAIKVFK